MEFAIIDIVLLVIIIILALRSMLNGFVAEALGAASIVFGLLFAFLFYARCAELLKERFEILNNIKYSPEVCGFVLLFLIVFIVVKIITAILKDIITRIKLSGADHLLGFLFGIVEGLLLAAIVIFVINIQPLFDSGKVLDKSLLNRYLSPQIEQVQDKLLEK
jgi:membrane protein required for colicin V production